MDGTPHCTHCRIQRPILATAYLALSVSCGGGLLFPYSKTIQDSYGPSSSSVAQLLRHVNAAPEALKHSAESIQAVAGLPGSVHRPNPPLAPFCQLSNRFRLALEPGDLLFLYNLDPQLVSAQPVICGFECPPRDAVNLTQAPDVLSLHGWCPPKSIAPSQCSSFRVLKIDFGVTPAPSFESSVWKAARKNAVGELLQDSCGIKL